MAAILSLDILMKKQQSRIDVLQGTLDLLVLRVLALEKLHGYGIARKLGELSDSAFQAEEGTLYPCLYRMERQGWIDSEVAQSENNRRARYYRITPAGRVHMRQEQAKWDRFVGAVENVITRTQGEL
jgi:transcriptional regulator